MPVLEVQHLEKHFGQTKVLEDISFSLDQGKALAVIGSSGSGKTTLLRCLNFLETPDRGRILVKGEPLFDAQDTSALSEEAIRQKRLHFGLVFQNFNLFPQYTALENVVLAVKLRQPDKSKWTGIEAQGLELLSRMGLSDRSGHYPHQLSGGQQQRVAIARALALQPDVLCFDEPTSALDPELTGEVLKVIRSLAEQNTTMIIVTHEMAFARDVADEVIFMDSGSIIEQGPAREVINSPRAERTRQFLSRYEAG
ncbi:MAG: amino acid ABC transporter ATP-binding protein [Oscillospiraceae bacterium]|nr:amino acid ABC transporter ATP-binding protein [Oscillospiraceae bacterium]